MIPPLTSPGSSALRWRVLSGQHPAPKCRTLFRLRSELHQLPGDVVEGGVSDTLHRVEEARFGRAARTAPVEVVRHCAYETPRGVVESDSFDILAPCMNDGINHFILALRPWGDILLKYLTRLVFIRATTHESLGETLKLSSVLVQLRHYLLGLVQLLAGGLGV